jgi:hypothetical protein
MSNGFIYVVEAHFIDKNERKKNPGPKCLCLPPMARMNVPVLQILLVTLVL